MLPHQHSHLFVMHVEVEKRCCDLMSCQHFELFTTNQQLVKLELVNTRIEIPTHPSFLNKSLFLVASHLSEHDV